MNNPTVAPTHCPICGAGVKKVGETEYNEGALCVNWVYFDCGGYMQSNNGKPYLHIAKLKCPDIEKAFEKLKEDYDLALECVRDIQPKSAADTLSISVNVLAHEWREMKAECERLRARIAYLEADKALSIEQVSQWNREVQP